jgi:3'(2'), 5'-bisphosphate nucleotidase
MVEPATRAPAMSHPPLETLHERVVSVAREAGRAILEVYAQEFEVTYKDDATPLTQADLAAQRVVRRGLARIDPALPFLSEEASAVPYATRRSWRAHWLVDPLDGTREFVERTGEFTVNIALVAAGRSVFGVVHAPLPDLTYTGGATIGAWRRQGSGPKEPIAVRAPEGRALTVFASRSHAGPETTAFLRSLAQHWDVSVTSRGSALKACLVADGQAHLYPRLGQTSEWDTAASQAIVEAAGGVLREIGSDRPLRYGKPDLHNPPFYVAYGPDAPHP